MSTEKKIYIDTVNLEIIVGGVNHICQALQVGPYGCTLQGILGDGSMKEQADAARRFLDDYYELTSGILELITGATGIIADGFANGELELSIADDDTTSNGEGVNA